MTRMADPASQRVEMVMRGIELGDTIYQHVTSTSVLKYLKECHRKKEKLQMYAPACQEIAKLEIGNLQWTDECFKAYVAKMFCGADVSQLEYFYRKYKATKHQTAFFLQFVRHEL